MAYFHSGTYYEVACVYPDETHTQKKKNEGDHRDHGECLLAELNTQYQNLMRVWDLVCTLGNFQKMMGVIALIQQ